MPVNIAINGYGRVGRMVLRALYEQDRRRDLSIIAVNDLGDAATNAHLTRHDTVHGAFPFKVVAEGDELIVDGDRIKVFAERDPSKLPWASLGVDVVLECTGLFTSKDKASAHIRAGARKVVISAPAKGEVDATVVYGVNHKTLKSSDRVISNASCTTNCLAPLAQVLHESVGVVRGLMTTIHAYTNDQVLIDGYHSDLRRARSATHSMIPTKTGAAAAVGLVLPELKGKLDGFAIRVPTINVSLVDLTFEAASDLSQGDRRGGPGRGEGAAQGHPRVHLRAPCVDGLQPHLRVVHLRRDADESKRGQARQSLRVVRQRVGLLEPHARYSARPRGAVGQIRVPTGDGAARAADWQSSLDLISGGLGRAAILPIDRVRCRRGQPQFPRRIRAPASPQRSVTPSDTEERLGVRLRVPRSVATDGQSPVRAARSAMDQIAAHWTIG
jgi:glyceraldehyde 3-phosphate dehydrogenase